MLLRCIKYTARILKHKYWVAYYAFKSGLYWQGLTHDMSKFSPTEFLPSVANFTEGKSSILVEKAKRGYSLAWLHHRGHNPHHYEYWIDKLDDGGVPLPMPYKYALELVCDYLGACHAYEDEFSYEKEWRFWQNHKEHIKMHPQTKYFVSLMLEGCHLTKSCEILNHAKEMYIVSEDWYKEISQRS